MKVLVTGGSGQVGQALLALPWPDKIALMAPTRGEMDLSAPARVTEALNAMPDLAAIVSLGGYTAVDQAQEDVGTAWCVNALAPALLAAHARRHGIPIVHLSTDYVFDGRKGEPYLEDDAVAPLGVYGASKEGGEQAVRTAAPRHAILRTSWIYGAHGTNFLRTMLRLAQTRPRIEVVADQRGRPTHAGELAGAIRDIVLRMIHDEAAPCGTFHLCGEGEASWCDFARDIFRQTALRGCLVPHVVPVATGDFPRPAPRPADSRLDTARIWAAYGIRLRPWTEGVAATLDQIFDETAKDNPA